MDYKVGDLIKFFEEKQRYTVQAAGKRYLVCTKPFNPKKTVLYTIVDLEDKWRSTNDLVFNSYDYETPEGCALCLRDLERNKVGLSRRNRVPLLIEEKEND